MRRHLTSREYHYAQEAIQQICLLLHIRMPDSEFESIGMHAFYRLYTTHSCVSDPQFWPCVYQAMEQDFLKEKRIRNRTRYADLSLDKPIAPDCDTTYLDTLRARQGDFTNGIALRDYLARLPDDLSALAFRLIRQDTLEEVRIVLGRDTFRLQDALPHLQQAMRLYLSIN